MRMCVVRMGFVPVIIIPAGVLAGRVMAAGVMGMLGKGRHTKKNFIFQLTLTKIQWLSDD